MYTPLGSSVLGLYISHFSSFSRSRELPKPIRNTEAFMSHSLCPLDKTSVEMCVEKGIGSLPESSLEKGCWASRKCTCKHNSVPYIDGGGGGTDLAEDDIDYVIRFQGDFGGIVI